MHAANPDDLELPSLVERRAERLIGPAHSHVVQLDTVPDSPIELTDWDDAQPPERGES
jgi:hypothetical protein